MYCTVYVYCSMYCTVYVMYCTVYVMYYTVYLQSLKCSLDNNIVFKSNKNGESFRARIQNSFLHIIFYSNKNTKERKFTSWKKTKKIF